MRRLPTLATSTSVPYNTYDKQGNVHVQAAFTPIALQKRLMSKHTAFTH